MNLLFKLLGSILTVSILTVNTAGARPWCNQGTIKKVDDIIWNENQILLYAGAVPIIITNPDKYMAVHASAEFSKRYATTPSSFSNEPDDGTVGVKPYDPPSLISAIDPSSYSISEGMKFEIYRCHFVLQRPNTPVW